MSPEEFIKRRIVSLKKTSASASSGDLVQDIFKIVMSHKFRKYSVTPEYKEHIRGAITKSVKNKAPIPLVWVLGGYKLWSLPQAPEADWAELFSLMYFVDWLKPILSIYEPGVWFDFFSDDVIVPLMNNIDPNDTKRYIESFQKLLNFISLKLPKGFRFTLNRVGDQYVTQDVFKKELKENIAKLTAERKTEAKPLTEKQIAAIDLNVKVTDVQKKDPYWRDKIQIIHDAYSLASKRRPYYRNPEKIMVLSAPAPSLIAVGTTKTSVVKFWVGAGALEKRDDGYIERILSPKQLAETTLKEVPVRIPGLPGQNFSSISII